MGRLQNTRCGTLYGAAEDYREGPPYGLELPRQPLPPRAAGGGGDGGADSSKYRGVWMDEAWGAQCGMVHQGEPADWRDASVYFGAAARPWCIPMTFSMAF